MGAFHVVASPEGAIVNPTINSIGVLDVFDALRRGMHDFSEKPSHYVFLGLLYPVIGVVLMAWSVGADMLPIMFPLASGFALLGPIAAIGLYEISRRREMGLDTSWRHALDVMKSPALPSIVAAAAVLLVLFVCWVLIAQSLYTYYFGEDAPSSLNIFLSNVLATEAGWQMMFWGNLIGLGFALVVLAISVVTFPLLIERDVGALSAIATSLRAFYHNPVPVLVWGLTIAVLLVIGSIPLFAGLAVVLPILGHATWHIYRKIIGPPDLRRANIGPGL
jgi:uncharacterized membrane protein